MPVAQFTFNYNYTYHYENDKQWMINILSQQLMEL